MKIFFRLFFSLVLMLAFVGVIHSYTADQPWPNETRNSWLAVGFFATVWGGTEVAVKRRGGVW